MLVAFYSKSYIYAVYQTANNTMPEQTTTNYRNVREEQLVTITAQNSGQIEQISEYLFREGPNRRGNQ